MSYFALLTLLQTVYIASVLFHCIREKTYGSVESLVESLEKNLNLGLFSPLFYKKDKVFPPGKT